MSKKTEIMERPAHQLATSNGDNPIAAMLSAIIEKGITGENVAAMERLTDLYLRIEGENARKAFARSKAELQAELPQVAAMRAIVVKGEVRSTYAKYEDISEQIRPALNRHGFSIDYTQRIDAGGNGKSERMAAICKLTHASGHSELYEFAARMCTPPGANEAQGDGSTWSYAKRGALCAALDIVVDHDSDARAEGGTITPEEAKALEARVEAIGGNKARFLKLAGAASFAEIRSAKADVMERFLSDQEKGRAAQKGSGPEPTASAAKATPQVQMSAEHEAAMAAQAPDPEPSREPSLRETVAITLAEMCDCPVEQASQRLERYAQQFFKKPFALLNEGTVKGMLAKVKDRTIRVEAVAAS